MNESKKKLIMGLLKDSSRTDVLGTSRFTEDHMLFLDILPAVESLRDKYPKAGAPKIASRINKVMNENGYPKFKLTAVALTKWYKTATGKSFCTDPAARARGDKLKARYLARKAKEAEANSTPIFQDEPEPETKPPVVSEPIGLDQVASMGEDEFIVNDDEDLAQAPDPFGGM